MSVTAAARIRIPSLRPLRRAQRLSTILLIVALLSTVLSSVPASRAFASAQASRPAPVSLSCCDARPQQPLRAPRTTCAIAGPYRGFASTAPLGQALSSHANMSAAVKDAVTPALLREVRDFWFEHLTNPKALIMPSFEDNKRWFFGGAALDEACTKRFAPTLEAIRNSGVTAGSEILSAVGPLTDPCDWMSLIILLDQIPRNCYRGDAARVVFTEFDPLARDVALAAMAAGVPDGEPEIRWRFAYRNWFYMPLMHSEDVATHDKAVAEYEKMLADVKSLTDGAGAGAGATGDEYKARAREVVQADVETATKLAGLNLEFERKHYDIIKKFGRYPHRNKAMGREATKEEVEYLANGGETFSQ